MKISISTVTLRGEKVLMVSCAPPGRARIRKYFRSRAEAQGAMMMLKKEFTADAGFFTGISPADRCDLECAWRAAQGSGKTVSEIVRQSLAKSSSNVTLKAAVELFQEEREKQQVSKRTSEALYYNCAAFLRGREVRAISSITRGEIVEYLKPYSGRTYNTYLASLRTFFKWAVASKLTTESPADSVIKIKTRNLQDDDLEPAILSVDQCRRLLRSAIQVDPGMVAYIAACLFGGLRPEREAAGLSWRDVGDQVLVMAKNAKSRQRRWVSNPLLMEWLAFGAIACAGALPVVGCRSRMERVRKDAGLLTGWGHDCMRHTFASMFMATHGAEKTIAQLGHGNYDMLFRHYRALVPEAVAKEFWSMRPSTLIPKSATP